MTEKNTCLQTFLALNISEFSLFFMSKLHSPHWKKSPPFPQQHPSKNWDSGKSPLSPVERGGGVQYGKATEY